MNNPRRKKLNTILEQLIKIHAALEEVKDEEQDYFDNIPENLRNSERYDKAENAVAALEEVKDEEQDYFDNIPENLRNSERYDKAENAVAALEDALSMFDEIADNIEVALE